MGYEDGNEWLASRNIFPLNISIGSHLPHATGMAWAARMQGEDTVVCCHFGDGATSEGNFHEACNFAGVFDAPVLFFCNNNQYAISMPRERQTASATIAQKARAYGFDGVRVDGMDPLASYAVTREAAERARANGGGDGGGDEGDGGDAPRPTLIEFVEYRFGAHTTADDPSAYRDPDDVDPWRVLDPVDRTETFLRETGRIDDEGVAAVRDEAAETVADAIDFAESVETDPSEMFDHAYAELPPEIRRQRDELLAAVEEHGDEAFRREE
jgi:pyruvate dehydrogenase E1 component alpha subunit